MRDLTTQERDQLEALVDACSAKAVLEALSEICGLKADHIRENWQDDKTARAWAEACGVAGIASTNVQV